MDTDYASLLWLIAFLLCVNAIDGAIFLWTTRRRGGVHPYMRRERKKWRRETTGGEIADLLTTFLEDKEWRGEIPEADVRFWYKQFRNVPILREQILPRWKPQYPHPEDLKAVIRPRVSAEGLAQVEAKYNKKPVNKLDAIFLQHPKPV